MRTPGLADRQERGARGARRAAVFAFADLPESVRRQTLPLLMPHPAIKQPFMPYALAKDEACYVGEPVAFVVADNRYLAEDAAQLVAVDYEPLPAVGDCRAARQGAPLVHVGSESNVAARFR
jgi:carbon-monoxide dehydrogenase large subunit